MRAISLAYTTVTSPIGKLKLVGSPAGLVALLWGNDNPRRVRLPTAEEDPTHPVLVEVAQRLAEYFARQRTVFTIPLAFAGTEFQQAVWQALLTIPYGETRTYGQIASQIGAPTAVRAVGAANSRNPIAIIAPCHRVIGASGALTGFAGGLAAKRTLLDLEARSLPDLLTDLQRVYRSAARRPARISLTGESC